MPQLAWDESTPTYTLKDQLGWERDLLGLYLSHHPLDEFKIYLSEKTFPIAELSLEMEGSNAELGGIVTELREITTKNGAKMAFVQISDFGGEIEIVVFPKLYSKDSSVWQRDNVLAIKGKLSSGGRGGGELKLITDQARIITSEEAQNYKDGGARAKVSIKKAKPQRIPMKKVEVVGTQRLYIRLQDSGDQPLLMALKEKLESHKGDTEVVLVTGASNSKQAIKLPQTVNINETSLRDLAAVFGPRNIVVR
jgi:DNA polymerase-3 subunit alpha